MATRPGLDRSTVVETALRLLIETGLEGLSLRRIATELDVKAPALYWHFTSKQALLDEMATEILRRMARATRDAPATVRWEDYLRQSMRLLRTTLLGYRDGAKVFAGTRFTDLGYADTMEVALRTLVEHGFSPRAAGRAWFTAYSYTIGFVIEEQAVHPVPGQRAPRYDVDRRTERLADTHPLAAAVGAELFTDYDAGFDAGLDALVTGMAKTLAGESGT